MVFTRQRISMKVYTYSVKKDKRNIIPYILYAGYFNWDFDVIYRFVILIQQIT